MDAAPNSSAPPQPADVELSVVIPTYQEAPNLPTLIERLFAATQAAGLAAEAIVVDDDSRDGTQEVSARLAEKYPLRLVVRRHERGLSTAVLRGFAEARGELLLVMDADLSHPPERVPDLVRPVRAGTAEFCVGSRYVQGGRMVDWSFLRWLNSRVATLLARPLTNVRDPMAGFFCLRRETWQRAAALDPIGYKIGLELLIKAGCQRVVEVPITFTDRLAGKSKMTARQQAAYLLHLWRLYRFRFPRLCAAGVAAVAVALAVVGIVLVRWIMR